MKKTTTYEIEYAYNNGLLGAIKKCKTLKEAEAFEEWYKNWADEIEKYFALYKVEKRKAFGITFSASYEKIEEWFEY